MVSHGRRAGTCLGAVQSGLHVCHWSRRAPKRCRGGAMVSHGRRARTCLGAVQSGLHVFTGEGVPKDYVQAYAWYNIAAAQGNETAKENLEIITKKMPTAGITKAQELSLEYWEAYGPDRASSE